MGSETKDEDYQMESGQQTEEVSDPEEEEKEEQQQQLGAKRRGRTAAGQQARKRRRASVGGVGMVGATGLRSLGKYGPGMLGSWGDSMRLKTRSGTRTCGRYCQELAAPRWASACLPDVPSCLAACVLPSCPRAS
jgi:hypothetical protein